MLSISTCKNQSTEVRDALHIPTYEFNYKVVTGCDKILQEYYITDRRKCENTKRCTIMNSTKDAHELQKGNSGDEQGAWKDGAPDSLLKIRASSAHLWSTTGRMHKLQAVGSEHAGPVESELPNECVVNAKWRAWISTRVSINLSQGACIQNRIVNIGIQEQVTR